MSRTSRTSPETQRRRPGDRRTSARKLILKLVVRRPLGCPLFRVVFRWRLRRRVLYSGTFGRVLFEALVLLDLVLVRRVEQQLLDVSRLQPLGGQVHQDLPQLAGRELQQVKTHFHHENTDIYSLNHKKKKKKKQKEEEEEEEERMTTVVSPDMLRYTRMYPPVRMVSGVFGIPRFSVTVV
ncbi:hypothetical protein EYF80_058387 [Liparis tanakae]|uniref:Uncharacterized protein n=1 Tax=Liparis tanakae TaxID=230148 RepID=A0A4Z2ES70_9TELE|nr:hypothetical protein EYF80_058387 [Liparis tanakae]